MHPHEEAFVRAFVSARHRDRWLDKLASEKHRSSFIYRLDQCYDFDERYAKSIAPASDVVTLLRSLGAPADCHVLSRLWEIDGLELPLAEVDARVNSGGWGTIVSCFPGRLAFYYDEVAARRLLLSRA